MRTALPALLSLVAALLCTALSLASSPSYGGIVSAALVFAGLHFWGVRKTIRLGKSSRRFAVLLPTPIVLILTADDIARLLHLLGLPGLRVLI